MADTLRVSTHLVAQAIKSSRQVLHNMLEEYWFKNRIRPMVNSNDIYSSIALSWDHTSMKIPKPLASFEDNKRYWDGKHKIYAKKKGVGVMSCKPHYALFYTDAGPGATSDCIDLRNNLDNLKQYRRPFSCWTPFSSWANISRRGHSLIFICQFYFEK